MEHEAEYERLMRDSSDYGELLRSGGVTRQGVDPDEWRAAIRAQARKDRIRVRTFRLGRRSATAALIDREPSLDELALAMRFVSWSGPLDAAARELGHELDRWLQNASGAASRCRLCDRRAYIDFSSPEPECEGEAFEEWCV